MNPTIYFFITLLFFVLPLFHLLFRRRNSKRLPPGSMGFPIIGQSLSVLKAMQANTTEQWLQQRIKKYGPVSKLSLFGTPTVFLHGLAANKFIYTSDGNTLANDQPKSIRMILGAKNLMELKGNDHKRVRGALLSFLKPEALKQSVGKMDEEIRLHINTHWHGQQKVSVMPSVKTLTFNVMCSLLFGIERGVKRETLVNLFEIMVAGLMLMPINLPFTRFNQSLRAAAKVKTIIRDLIREKREALEKHGSSPDQDLITCLLYMRGKDNSVVISDEEIVDNAILTMVAGYDTTSTLITFLVKTLATDPSIYAAIVQEQEQIAKCKSPGEPLTWDDLAKMKYTWRVATETLRMTPPVLFSFRKTLKDIEYEGYTIPKGWQVVWATTMTHMDESIFPNPTKFDPTRFDKKAPAPPYSLVAFGAGQRICPGNEFARIESLSTIHYLVTHFSWKLDCKDASFSRDPLPIFNEGLPIQITSKIKQ